MKSPLTKRSHGCALEYPDLTTVIFSLSNNEVREKDISTFCRVSI